MMSRTTQTSGELGDPNIERDYNYRNGKCRTVKSQNNLRVSGVGQISSMRGNNSPNIISFRCHRP